MIRSMTAFAACERAGSAGQLSCELRSVNHRFLELSLRLPEELRAGREPALRERVACKLSRAARSTCPCACASASARARS